MDTNIQSLSVNGHKLKIQLRDIIWFITTGVALVAIYFSSLNARTKQQEAIVDLYSLAKTAEAKGQIAHDENIVQAQKIADNANRIEELNRSIRDIAPKVDKIDANVLWLMGKQVERK